ncbi:MAG: hypothetical protein AAF546_00515 [Verrucomicrobiota bacterium]
MKTWHTAKIQRWERCLNKLGETITKSVSAADKIEDPILHQPGSSLSLAKEIEPPEGSGTTIPSETATTEYPEKIPVSGSEELEPRVVVETSTSTRLPIEKLGQQKCAAFFAALPWSKEASGSLKEERFDQQVPVVEDTAQKGSGDLPGRIFIQPEWKSEDATSTRSESAQAFFQSIPWSGDQEEIASFSISTAQEDDGYEAKDAMQEPSNLLMAGLLSASHTSKRISTTPGETTNRRDNHRAANLFFQSLPWQ